MPATETTLYFGEISPVIILWIHSNTHKLLTPIALNVEGKTVTDSLFLMSMEEGKTYLLVARLELGIGSPLAVTFADGYTIPIPTHQKTSINWVNTLLPSQLQAVRNGLIRLLPKVIKDLPEHCLTRLHEAVAISNIQPYTLMDGRLYVSFAAPPFSESFNTAQLCWGTNPGVRMDTRYTEGVLHLLSQKPLPKGFLPARISTAHLNTDDGLVWPLSLKRYRKAVDEQAITQGFTERMSGKTRSGISGLHGDTLKGYCLDEQKPYQALELEAYLDGRYVTRIQANQSGVEYNGKPLNCGWSWPLPPEAFDGERHEIDWVRTDTQHRLSDCPFQLGPDIIDSQFNLTDGITLKGYIKPRGPRSDLPSIAVRLDGQLLNVNIRVARIKHSERVPAWQVEIPLPAQVNDGRPHAIEIELLTGSIVLKNTRLDYQAQYAGQIERMDLELISGWIYQKQNPLKPVTLDVIVNGEAIGQVVANLHPKTTVKLTTEDDPIPCGFYFRLGPATVYETSRTISLHIADTPTEVLGPPIVFTPYDMIISALMTAQACLQGYEHNLTLANGIETSAVATRWVRQQVLAPIIKNLRETRRIPQSLKLDFTDTVRLDSPNNFDEVIDIIVPVYLGLQETMLCIRSILDNTRIAHELIVINDASPDPALCKLLRAWSDTGVFTLLENSSNMGFVATVNRGMRLHPERDVVLLNSDTVVPPDWLVRLTTAVQTAPNIATATPFSNNATILSFPQINKENPMPGGNEFFDIAERFATLNRNLVLDIPTAVGFCMYIRRQALNEVGIFDEHNFKQGYGEENDFSLRASAMGWRHVAVADCYVAHHGGKSFSSQKAELLRRNLATLTRVYPEYLGIIERFTRQDSLRVARNTIIKSLLKNVSDGYVLLVQHDLEGGIKTHTDDLAKRLKNSGAMSLQLSMDAHGDWTLMAPNTPYQMTYKGRDACQQIADDLAELGVWHIHYHHVLHFSHDIWSLPLKLGVDYDVTIHDYHMICPTINMMDETGQYCGDSQFNTNNCTRCLQINKLEDNNPGLGLERQYSALGNQMDSWRSFYAKQLTAARRVFAPTRTTAEILARHYTLPNLVVLPHPETPVSIKPIEKLKPPFRIAIIGAIGEHKGYSLLLECARSALKNGLPLQFVVLGYTKSDEPFQALSNVTLMGAYNPDELPQKLVESNCRIAAYLSVWPETYAYTLSEAWRCGLYPVALDMGGISERIHQSGFGAIIPFTREARQINSSLIAVARTVHAIKPEGLVMGTEYADILLDYYGFQR